MIPNIGYVEDLTLDDLENLYKFVQKLNDDIEDTESRERMVLNRLLHFLPQNVESLDEIMDIIETKSEDKLKVFKEKYGKNKINKSGMHFDRIIEMEYEHAKNYLEQNNNIDPTKNKVIKQIVDAKELNCIKVKKGKKSNDELKSMYQVMRLKTNNLDVIKEYDILELQKILLDRFPTQPDAVSSFIYTIYEYCNKKSKPEKYSTFLGTVFRRIQLLDKDDDVESTSNGEFLENIKSVLNIFLRGY